MSQDPFGQSKQLTLNIQSGSQAHVGDETQVGGGQQKRPLENVTQSGLLEGNPGLNIHQNMAPKGKSVQSQEPIKYCDELYPSLHLVHKEKVTGCHHPYASKPRTAHSSSSREKIVNDEDENMSPNQSETNDDPRRDNFMEDEGALSQRVSSPTLKGAFPKVFLNNLRSESKGIRLPKLTMWKNVQARRSNKDG
ncbi:hypothetical protein O181_073529 [Austropuccinia psidii MF-1]|uniref:Uncharacterized protein n=1 Tax=Austropuccinia psidii MF-1 TaxID=1389203 RepID=A0A9Q3ICJ6_9BASI|nr:hypothetical protein [Austropuccinia psidii MF-1]